MKSALLKSSFFCNSLILCGSLEGDPLSPPEGEAAQGEHPLVPLFFKEYFSTLSSKFSLFFIHYANRFENIVLFWFEWYMYIPLSIACAQ